MDRRSDTDTHFVSTQGSIYNTTVTPTAVASVGKVTAGKLETGEIRSWDQLVLCGPTAIHKLLLSD